MSKCHMFSVDDAVKYGVEKAVIIQNLRFWLEKVRGNDKDSHKHDGYYWTYNSAKSFAELFPYFSKSKIHRMLSQLEDDGVILSGNYNKMAYDRTKWYSMPEFSISQESNVQVSELKNGNSQSESPIPYVIPDGNPNSNPINISFDDFWDLYDYKKGKKSNVEAKWNGLKDSERTAIMQNLPAYKLSTPDKRFRKQPLVYLNNEAWLDEITPSYPVNNQPSCNQGVSYDHYQPRQSAADAFGDRLEQQLAAEQGWARNERTVN